jgi:hypothetical protein
MEGLLSDVLDGVIRPVRVQPGLLDLLGVHGRVVGGGRVGGGDRFSRVDDFRLDWRKRDRLRGGRDVVGVLEVLEGARVRPSRNVGNGSEHGRDWSRRRRSVSGSS